MHAHGCLYHVVVWVPTSCTDTFIGFLKTLKRIAYNYLHINIIFFPFCENKEIIYTILSLQLLDFSLDTIHVEQEQTEILSI